mmetsp:Transcript_63527/g.124738  ORF Transcript_63527/g.124738 Transcript_63527/m.124738 type:complete len:239 (+) Transcript_63527:37-753(+)
MALPMRLLVTLALALGTSAFTPTSRIWTRSAVTTNMMDVGQRKGDDGSKRRDKDGFIVFDDLEYDTSGKDVSQDLGSSAGYVALPAAVEEYIAKLKASPTSIAFAETMAMIDANCEYLPNAFNVGDVFSKKGENEGSNKIFSFARLTGLAADPIETTLAMFGEYYQKDVLGNPSGSDHGNIRGALKLGWPGVVFPNGISTSLKDRTWTCDSDVAELLAKAEVIEGGEGWDPMSDCWIP